MVLLSNYQNIYIIFASLGAVIILFLLLIFFYVNFYRKKHIDRAIYSRLIRFADLNDYLLLNNYNIQLTDKALGKINHVLITNKYIILINDFSFSGVLEGDYYDEQIKITDEKGERLELNPLTYNRNLTKRVALNNAIELSFFRGIVVINDDSEIKITNLPSEFKICRIKELTKIINEFDSSDVKPFKEKDIETFIKYLNNINIREKE